MKLTKINIKLSVNNINNLKLAEEQIVQDIALAVTTCHTLSLGLESTLLLGVVIALKVYFSSAS